MALNDQDLIAFKRLVDDYSSTTTGYGQGKPGPTVAVNIDAIGATYCREHHNTIIIIIIRHTVQTTDCLILSKWSESIKTPDEV